MPNGMLSWDEAAPRLMPRLRDATFLDLTTLQATLAGHVPAYRALAPGLFVTLVIDDQHTMTSVSGAMLERWGKSFDEAAERARTNLVDVSRDDFLELGDGLWIAPWDDAYAASRVLLSHVLQRLAIDPLVAVPNRDTLLVARARSASAVGALVTAIEKAAALLDGSAERQSSPLTHRIFRLHDRSLEPFEVPEAHPASVSHYNMCVSELVQCYGEQQRALHELDDDIYVASIEADQARDGRLKTRALWTRGVDTLLPRVDRVHLLYPEERDGEPISSRIWVTHWEKLAELPDALEPTLHHLPRFRTRRFPDEALDRIAKPVEIDRSVSELTV